MTTAHFPGPQNSTFADEVHFSRVIPASIDEVWMALYRFDQLGMCLRRVVDITMIEGDGRRVGSVCELRFDDGRISRHRLLGLDDNDHRMVIETLDSLLPAVSLITDVDLLPIAHDETTLVQWNSRFRASSSESLHSISHSMLSLFRCSAERLHALLS